jgi:hypothetical protein
MIHILLCHISLNHLPIDSACFVLFVSIKVIDGFDNIKSINYFHNLLIFIDFDGSIFIESFFTLPVPFFVFVDFIIMSYSKVPPCSSFLHPLRELFILDLWLHFYLERLTKLWLNF